MSEEAIIESAPEAESAVIEESTSTGDFFADNAASSEESSESEVVEVAAETESELKDEIEDAIEEGASEEEVKNMIREFTLKVNGKEFKRQIDLNDEEAVKKELQLGLAGRQAMQRSKELKSI